MFERMQFYNADFFSANLKVTHFTGFDFSGKNGEPSVEEGRNCKVAGNGTNLYSAVTTALSITSSLIFKRTYNQEIGFKRIKFK